MTKKKETKKPQVKKASTKIPVPLKEWDHKSEFPLKEISHGDEVESAHHGVGVMKNFVGGNFPLQIEFQHGRLLTYTADGRYFEKDCSFYEKHPTLKIIKKAPEEE